MPAKEVSMCTSSTGPFRTAVVVTGGDAPVATSLEHLPIGVPFLVIGADSGVGHAIALGLTVDIAVGDFDSIDPVDLRTIEDAGVDIRRHPADKDATDLELALDIALAAGVSQILMLGGHGGRLDHLLGNAMVLASQRYAGVDITAVMGDAVVTIVRPGVEVVLRGVAGSYVSVLAVHGPASDVHLRGLEWSLAGEMLHPGSTLGVSNRFIDTDARVRIGSGTLLIIQPGVSP
jgi:thiamine pyrophosphokinase